MRRNGRPPQPDHRLPWQIAQGGRCGCRGTDDLCQCQNAEEPWKYGLAPRPKPPTPLTRSPARDVHQVIYTFATADASRAFREEVAKIQLAPPLSPSAASAGNPARDEQ